MGIGRRGPQICGSGGAGPFTVRLLVAYATVHDGTLLLTLHLPFTPRRRSWHSTTQNQRVCFPCAVFCVCASCRRSIVRHWPPSTSTSTITMDDAMPPSLDHSTEPQKQTRGRTRSIAHIEAQRSFSTGNEPVNVRGVRFHLMLHQMAPPSPRTLHSHCYPISEIRQS